MKNKLSLTIIFTILLVSLAFTQETSSALSGKIKDASENYTVKITYLPKNSHYETTTNKEGQFSLDNLDVGGPYKIEVYDEKQTIVYSKEDIHLSLGKNDLPPIYLTNDSNKKKENKIEEITISVKKGNVKDGRNISETQIQGLPNINRGIQDITKLVPQSANNSFAGTNFRYNNVTIDGSINNDAIGFSPSLGGQTETSGMPGSSTRTNSISLDAIQDIQVYIAPYDVKLGNFLGGSVNAVTRSGSNDVTGSIYTFGRNALITGPNNAGDGSKMPKSFGDYILGGRIGLPIVKDKLFFFTNFEYTKRTYPVFYNASNGGLVDVATAKSITDFVKNHYGFDAGNFMNYSNESQSLKFFNKLDWKINDRNSFSIRNNTVLSEATNLEKDGANFRLGSMDFKQKNVSSSTTAELKSRFNRHLNNSLILGYSSIHDFRNPMSMNAMFPQVEIGYNGGTIFLGNEREATVFNMKQNTFEITDNQSDI
ncbi:hypothetical protein [Fluviicola sp.]|jgi:hypothetical protein|uniref:TonB-dependent receptor n=1 Tax=Fluviicola sp. TaxID=1917219 RepID=UPI0028222CEF|nr:hypothetical protein [Fluviicola sp.]MDR0802683.1 hypothetical protein [Fluviicola sp.]